jgi:hypothetical protein
MNNQRLGCLTPMGLIAALVTALVVAGFGFAQGGALFSPGELNARTGGALRGITAHADLSQNCAACHPAPWEPATLTSRCLDCHKGIRGELNDSHSLHGSLVPAAAQANCRACHTEHNGPQAALTRVDMSGFAHDQVGFSLKGHAKLSGGLPFQCKDCHGSPFTEASDQGCVDCHARMDSAYVVEHLAAFGPACQNCHDGLDTYGIIFDHNKERFPLAGKHGGVSCHDCHQKATSLAALKSTPVECAACHQKDDPHQGSLGTDCAACHSPEGWKPATFDHAKSNFPLTGKHSGLPCADCHANQVFKGTPANCFACHQKDDHHNGQFGADCAACHATSAWKPATFDHAKAAFPLTGAHTSVPCARCHSSGFAGTPTACSACHQEPAFHIGLFPTDCAACHNTSAWRPASFNASHTFPIDHGGANTCRDCHPSALNVYTCYTCHNQAEMANKHREENVGDISDCVRCHANGREKEGGGD